MDQLRHEWAVDGMNEVQNIHRVITYVTTFIESYCVLYSVTYVITFMESNCVQYSTWVHVNLYLLQDILKVSYFATFMLLYTETEFILHSNLTLFYFTLENNNLGERKYRIYGTCLDLCLSSDHVHVTVCLCVPFVIMCVSVCMTQECDECDCMVCVQVCVYVSLQSTAYGPFRELLPIPASFLLSSDNSCQSNVKL